MKYGSTFCCDSWIHSTHTINSNYIGTYNFSYIDLFKFSENYSVPKYKIKWRYRLKKQKTQKKNTIGLLLKLIMISV